MSETDLWTKLAALEKIKIKEEWIIQQFIFTKLTLTKDLYWELILDLYDDLDSVSMEYECVLVNNPKPYNSSLSSVIFEYNRPQQSMDNWESFLKRMEKIHSEYDKESNFIWTHRFIAKVVKYESKTKTNQIKLYISKETAEFLLNNAQSLKNSNWDSKYVIIFLDNK